jgi:hypothetical protein
MSNNSLGSNLIMALGSGLIFAASVANAMVYARGTTSSNNEEDIDIGVNTNCSYIMLSINIIVAIITFVLFCFFVYRTFTSSSQRNEISEDINKTIQAKLDAFKAEWNADRPLIKSKKVSV